MQPELYTEINIYKKRFPDFGRPKIIGFIDLQNLKFAKSIKQGSVNLDLNYLIHEAKRKPSDRDVKLTELLKFLLRYEQHLELPFANNLENANFFCYRGLLTCVACTPYENREPWKIVAILYKGQIFLCARDTEEKITRNQNMTDRDKQFTSWGYKFEQYILSDSPDGEPNPDVPVDENEEFSLVLTTHINRHNIIYGAEMDGIRCDLETVDIPPKEDAGLDNVVEYLSNKKFIELKTNRHIEFPNQENSFRRFKTKKWWCQSFLVGIDTILCGFRNDDGMVERLEPFSVKELPKMSRKFWDPNVCFNFLDTFLTYVKRCLTREIRHKYGDRALKNLQEVPQVSVMFEWAPRCPVRLATHYSHEDDPILHDWFINSYGKSNNRS